MVLFCDFLNRAELAGDHLPQDLLYVITLYVEALGNAVRAQHSDKGDAAEGGVKKYAILAPSRAARSAIAGPMPREAPVMKRVLLLSDIDVTACVQRMLRRPPSPPANLSVR